MASDTKPILLRPPCALADAMTEAADNAGVSRQVWMLQVLTDAAAPYMTTAQDPAQLTIEV